METYSINARCGRRVPRNPEYGCPGLGVRGLRVWGLRVRFRLCSFLDPLAELLGRSTERAGEGGQLRRSEYEENDEQDYQQFLPSETEQ